MESNSILDGVKIEKQVFTGDDLLQMNNSIPDEEMAVPDIDHLTSGLVAIMEYVERDDIYELKNLNPIAFEEHLAEKFPEHFDRYYSTIMTLINTKADNINNFIHMINTFKEVRDKGKNIDLEYENYKEHLAEQFIYPDHGGKEEFENKMKNSQNEKKHKKKKHKK
jgi:hypothetical protein